MNVGRKAVLGIGALVGLLTLGTTAHALTSLTIDKCLSGKIKTEGKGAAAYIGCYAKGASKGTPTDPVCTGKASGKIVPAFGKLDAKYTCLVEGDGGARDTDTSNYATALDTSVGHTAGKCDAAKQKCVGKYIAGVTGCYSKAAGKTGTVDPTCVGKVAGKLADGVKGCLDKAAAAGDCTNAGSQAAALKSAADTYIDAQACELDPSNPGCTPPPTPTPTSTPGAPTCGNGLNDPGEACDASAPSAGWAQCGPTFTCVGCTCACPSTVTFTGDATSALSTLDTGWTGISHRAPIISNGTTTVTLSGCTGSTRPCGVCNVSGPVENPSAGAGQLATRRCLSNTATQCTSDASCTGGPGDCQFFFGAPLPLAAGGVSTCVVNAFNGGVSGTANVETGYAVTSAKLTARVYNGLAIDNPCPRCTDAGGFNDGVTGGTCDGGARVNQACDANGDVPGRPDFGRTSLDCPPNDAAKIATLSIDLSNKTDVVTRTLTTSSPNCTASAGDKCLCNTCNNGNAEPCFTNADCPDPDGAGPFNPVCGGTRCLSGTNAGAPCSTASQCPGGSCTRPGEPTKPSGCVDDTTVADRVMECVDGGNGEGNCTVGPTDQNCTVASGHGQRGCLNDGDCGGGVGSCASVPRHCFLTGGGTFQPSGQNDGSDTLTAVGMADAPMQDVSNPTLAAVFCVGPTGAPAVNNVAGLPGPSRITLHGQAVGKP